MRFLLRLPDWAWLLLKRHFSGVHTRPAVKWMNRFAFLGLVVGVFAWTSIVSIMKGLQADRKERILSEKAHFLWEARPTKGLREQEESIRKVFGSELKSLQFILQTEGLLEVPSHKQSGRITGSGVVIQGVDGLDKKVSAGIELMSSLMFGPGEMIRLNNVWKVDSLPLDLPVDASFESGIYDIDRSTIRMDRKILEEWLGLSDAVSRVEIQIANPYYVDEFATALDQVTGRSWKTWKQTEASLWYSLRLEMIVMTISVFFVVLIAAFAAHLALSVRVADKVREIGLLRALGADDRILSRLYLNEGILLGVTGSLTGLFLGYIFCRLLPKIFKMPDIYYYASMPVKWDWSTNITLTLLAIALAVFASYWPARKVRGVEIQEALRS